MDGYWAFGLGVIYLVFLSSTKCLFILNHRKKRKFTFSDFPGSAKHRNHQE